MGVINTNQDLDDKMNDDSPIKVMTYAEYENEYNIHLAHEIQTFKNSCLKLAELPKCHGFIVNIYREIETPFLSLDFKVEYQSTELVTKLSFL